jgi:hypothetical protein
MISLTEEAAKANRNMSEDADLEQFFASLLNPVDVQVLSMECQWIRQRNQIN